jgi:hypothetical protein
LEDITTADLNVGANQLAFIAACREKGIIFVEKGSLTLLE